MVLREWLDMLEAFEIAMDGNEWFVTFHQSFIFPVSVSQVRAHWPCGEQGLRPL